MKKFAFKKELFLTVWFMIALVTSLATIGWTDTHLVIIGLVNLVANIVAIIFLFLYLDGSPRTKGTKIILKWNRKVRT